MASDIGRMLDSCNLVLRELGHSLGVEIHGSGDGPERIRRVALTDELEVGFALPKKYGKARISSMALLRSTSSELVDVVATEVESARDRLRGDLLVELANDVFTLPDQLPEEQWQLLERAGLRIMAAVERNRKERG